MSRARGWWARFARLPAAARVALALGVVAVYTLAIILLVGGEGDGDRKAAAPPQGGTAERSEADGGDERAVQAIFASLRPRTPESDDQAKLRQFVLRGVRCGTDECRVRYTTGVPGAGLILEQQGTVLQRILQETGVDRVSFDVRRQKTLRGAGDPEPAEEETTSGTPLFALRCDRARSPQTDPGRTDGRALVRRICTIRTPDVGAQHSTSPSRRSGGAGGDGALEEIPEE